MRISAEYDMIFVAGKPDFEMSHCYLNQALFFANRGYVESAMVLFDDAFSWHAGRSVLQIENFEGPNPRR